VDAALLTGVEKGVKVSAAPAAMIVLAMIVRVCALVHSTRAPPGDVS